MCSIAHFSIRICAEASQILGSQRRNRIRDFYARSSAPKRFGMEENMKVYEAEILIPEKAVLGEGPVWDGCGKRLFYVDIEGKQVRRYDFQTGELKMAKTAKMPGCLVPSCKGGWITAQEDRLIRMDDDLNFAEEAGRLEQPGYLRFNDGKCDGKGRLWVGTMAADQNIPQAPKAGTLYCMEEGKEPLPMAEGITIPNGMAWTEDNSCFYHVDTAEGCVRGYAFDLETGKLGERRTVIRIDAKDGSPDGMCMDAEGKLWIALWGGGRVIRVDPATGEWMAEVSVPASRVSCCTFGGPELNELIITTAMDENGNGGEVFIAETDVKGVPAFRYGKGYGEEHPVAVITGASRGIGRQTALLFAERGYDVAVHYNTGEKEAQEVCRLARAFGVRAESFRADVGNLMDLKRMYHEIDEKYGRIDVLVNNAGNSSEVMFLNATEEMFDAMTATDWKGVFFSTQLAAERMIKQGIHGVIINLTSNQTAGCWPRATIYAPSKAAVRKFTENVSMELAHYGIRVAAVAPGYTDVGWEPGDHRYEATKRLPLKRFATTREIAEGIFWLASPAAAYVTGSTLTIDGGATLPVTADFDFETDNR